MEAYIPHLRLVGPNFEPLRRVCSGELGLLFRSSLFDCVKGMSVLLRLLEWVHKLMHDSLSCHRARWNSYWKI